MRNRPQPPSTSIILTPNCRNTGRAPDAGSRRELATRVPKPAALRHWTAESFQAYPARSTSCVTQLEGEYNSFLAQSCPRPRAAGFWTTGASRQRLVPRRRALSLLRQQINRGQYQQEV